MVAVFEPIGIIHTPFKVLSEVPTQGGGETETEGTIHIFPRFKEGLKDIEGFSHLIVIYHFHHVENFSLISRPSMDNTPRGVFAIRSPRRPNPVGFTVVELTGREETTLRIRGVDMLDETPVLDIKPYIPRFDSPRVTRQGWFENVLRSRDSENPVSAGNRASRSDTGAAEPAAGRAKQGKKEMKKPE